MQKHRWLIFLCLALVLLIPLFMLITSLIEGRSIRMDAFSASDYFAITDATGNEAVYRPTDPLFSEAAAVFARAERIGEADGEDAAPQGNLLLLEWISDGRAERFTLTCHPQSLRATLTDRNGCEYRLTCADLAVFFATDCGRSLLVGDPPPVLTVGGRTVSPAILAWTVSLPSGEGEPLSFDSGEYRTGAPVLSVSVSEFSCIFAQSPVSLTYTLFCGSASLFSGSTTPPFASLAPGDYQVVLVAEWTAEHQTVRAGYTLTVTVT